MITEAKINTGVSDILEDNNNKIKAPAFIQRYDVYLNTGTPKENGKWVKFSAYNEVIKNNLAYKELLLTSEKIRDDWEKLANGTSQELNKSDKVNSCLMGLSFFLLVALIVKEDLLNFHHNLFL